MVALNLQKLMLPKFESSFRLSFCPYGFVDAPTLDRSLTFLWPSLKRRERNVDPLDRPSVCLSVHPSASAPPYVRFERGFIQNAMPARSIDVDIYRMRNDAAEHGPTPTLSQPVLHLRCIATSTSRIPAQASRKRFLNSALTELRFFDRSSYGNS